MGRLVFGGRVFFYLPSCDHSSDEQALLRPEPPPNAAVWRYFKFYGRCFMAAVSVAMIVYILVVRHYNWDPDMQDPYKMTALLVASLAPVGFGFMMTHEDAVETQDTHLQEPQAHV